MFISLILFNFAGCSYSFTGASVPEHLKSIAIPVWEDKSGSAEAGSREFGTNELIREFIEDNSLRISEAKAADSICECSILSINDNPEVVSAGENVSKRKITVTVRVIFRDKVMHKTVFDRNFSNEGEYSTATTDYLSQRKAAIQTALSKIAEDILLGVVSNW